MMKEVMTGTYIKNDEYINFNFKTDLTTYEKANFVAAVTNALVGENYLPVLRNMFFDFYTIAIFTDVDISIDDSDESIDVVEEVENFVNETNIVDIVRANIDDELIDELNKAIDDNIEYRTGIHKNALNDALASLVNTLENKVNQIDLTSAMDMIQAFGGMTEDFTPESLVNAYMNTDVAKQNIKDLNEAKEKKAKIADEMAKVIDITDKK